MTLFPKIDVDDTLGARLIDGFCLQQGYQALLLNDLTGVSIPNPESKIQFFRKKTREFWKESVRAAEIHAAGEQAKKAAADKADLELNF